jgi:hypothetical protein
MRQCGLAVVAVARLLMVVEELLEATVAAELSLAAATGKAKGWV